MTVSPTSAPLGPRLTRILSLGAGVQSTTLALMAARGVIGPMPDCAIFADTGAEPSAVYRHLEWLCSGVLPFPVHRVAEASGLVEIIGKKRPTGEWVHMPIPAFIAGKDGRAALLNRSCTQDYKLRPIRRKVRELVGLTGKRSPKSPVVEQWIGISMDEVSRMKESPSTQRGGAIRGGLPVLREILMSERTLASFGGGESRPDPAQCEHVWGWERITLSTNLCDPKPVVCARCGKRRAWRKADTGNLTVHAAADAPAPTPEHAPS